MRRLRWRCAQLLRVTHNIDNKVTGVDEVVRRVDENVLVVKSEVELVNDNVKAVDDKVQTMADGRQRLFSESSASSLTFIVQMARRPAKEVKSIVQQTADGVDDVKRS